ncbi:MAG TPA: hypothetical protein VIM75_02300 [Ohtaekwangia sp.]|uniref:tetratricopeptide repeat protein n=1 Tax=Ohtaekwangia sp. TaxID=2066019 RepID=UPI002F93FF37
MRLFITIILVSSIASRSGCQPNSSYCGNSNHYDLSEIEKLDIYEETTVVKLAAFKPTDAGNGPLKIGYVDAGVFLELKTLSTTDRDDLLKILVNYNFTFDKVKSIKKTVVFCYDPENAILLYDRKDRVIGYIELCFECFGYKNQPTSLTVGDFCDEKFEILKDLFKRNGIQYGVVPANNNDEQFDNLSKELEKHPDNPIVLISMAKLKADDGDFSKALEILDRVVVLDSTNRHAYFLRGHCRLMIKDYEGAEHDFSRVLELNPEVTQAYHERALAMIEIFETTHNNQLLVKICNDLEMVQQLGDGSTVSLHQKYCKR